MEHWHVIRGVLYWYSGTGATVAFAENVTGPMTEDEAVSALHDLFNEHSGDACVTLVVRNGRSRYFADGRGGVYSVVTCVANPCTRVVRGEEGNGG